MNGSCPEDATPLQTRMPRQSPYSLATLAVHADDVLNSSTDVAPAMHVSTTFRYSRNPDELQPALDDDTPERLPHDSALSSTHIYSRLSGPNTSRLESILTTLLHGPALTYASGLSAFHALLVWTHPRVVAIGGGYHGCHGVLAIYQKLTACRIADLHDPATWADLGPGDLVHMETPLNPTGEASSIAHYAALAHARGAALSVDATFAPPPLQDPFAHGADYVMHSGTKYFGGHSDMLCGVLAVGTRDRPGWEKDYWGLYHERIYLGAVMGSLEGWLGVRSLRTLELRVVRQSENAARLVAWLDGAVAGAGADEGCAAVAATVARVQHASLQKADMDWLRTQMPNGYGPVFAIVMKSSDFARRLPSKLHLFHHATSLGGVESLIEWRAMSDDKVDPSLLRVSVGVENWEDLKQDLLDGFKALAADGREQDT